MDAMSLCALNIVFYAQCGMRRGKLCYTMPMPAIRDRPIRILAHLYAMQKASREMSGGILHYAAVHPDVQAQLYGIGTPRRRREEFRAWRPDGIILGATDEATLRSVEALGCRAAVFVNARPAAPTTLRWGSVYCSNTAVAESAAKVFAGKRLAHFAFVGTRTDDEWSGERGAAFRRLAAAAGCSFSEFKSPRTARSNHRNELAALAEWSKRLPKPCGIFAACDARAKDVLDACALARVPIPEQAMVLGVDNEEFICRQTLPTLSSVVPDFAHGGYLAAEMLVDLIAGKKRRMPPMTFGVKGVVERMSTTDTRETGRMVGRAQEFIRTYATSTDISVADVAKASGTSLRLLQKNFKAVAGTTICDALQTERLKRVCEILSETSTPIGQIGELCGFGNDAYLKKLFHRRFGCTMRDYRAEH